MIFFSDAQQTREEGSKTHLQTHILRSDQKVQIHEEEWPFNGYWESVTKQLYLGFDQMIEYNKEVAFHEVGVHFRGVRGNSFQMLHVLERE